MPPKTRAHSPRPLDFRTLRTAIPGFNATKNVVHPEGTFWKTTALKKALLVALP